MKNPLHKRPWLLFWVAFGILISVWTCFITLAVKNRPEMVPLVNAKEKPPHDLLDLWISLAIVVLVLGGFGLVALFTRGHRRREKKQADQEKNHD